MRNQSDAASLFPSTRRSNSNGRTATPEFEVARMLTRLKRLANSDLRRC